MSEFPIQLIEDVEFLDNPENRCPVVLLLDTSGSMNGTPISELNSGITRLKSSLLEDDMASLRVDIAVVTFGGGVSVVQGFATPDALSPPELRASGNTPMGAAIEKGIDILEERKQLYKKNGILYYRPWVMLITDGAPTDSWQSAANKIQTAEANSKLLFFAIGVEGADMNKLKQIASPVRTPMKLTELRFEELFEWLSASLQQVSRGKIGEFKALPSTGGWGEIPV